MYRTDISYGSLRDTEQEVAAASWKKFNVILAGKTDGAHKTIVRRLRASGHTKVSSPEDSDYLLVFCPVSSKVETDISGALQNITDGKPVILVVMHHTFNPDHIVADSRRQVDNPNVCLTVDFLFYEGKLLTSNCNDIAWREIQKFLGVPVSSNSTPQHDFLISFFLICFSSIRQCFFCIHQYLLVVCSCLTRDRNNRRMLIVVGIPVVVLLVIVVTTVIVGQQKSCENCTNIHDSAREHNNSLQYNPNS